VRNFLNAPLDEYFRQQQERCKRRAPFEISAENIVREDAMYAVRRTVPMLNNFNKAILTSLMCNNNIKLITSGSGTNDLAYYLFGYATKKQGRSYNQAALLAKSYLFPEYASTNENDTSLQEHARCLLIRCMNTLAREQEITGPLVVTYLMGWGDTFQSHHFVPMYWKEIEQAVLAADPALQEETDRLSYVFA